MRIYYTCDCCGEPIDEIEVEEVDDAKFGFDCLTAKERQDIIKVDTAAGVMQVQSLCDKCIEYLGFQDSGDKGTGHRFLH
ncbi:anti-sigma-F factor Fin [Propionispora hippei]|uniref:DUF2757 domain-containing protein n=1 Tax=Propionispora hippei DSM 15287 TaxID=1123003 RepID=A0A1M6JQV3_9FIRM|nr:anti-sigma-F factor Fin [Propionispora hippei]SHJ49012.1 Protein of unknown function [Propionispora hippei DSM 15287]